VLDVACGEGRHALKAAQWGAEVIGIDNDDAKLEIGREAASRLDVSVEWECVDLTATWPDLGRFDAILVFNYLDRGRMNELKERLAPGGLLIMETYLDWQRQLGWGPTADAHLLKPGELARIAAPLEILHGREVFEPLEANKVRAVASIVAQKR
jgi:SAM-dependent methyltransferase